MPPRKAATPTEHEEVIPEVFFDAIMFLFPGLNKVAEECGVSIGEWIIMRHIQQAGVKNTEGRPTMLRQSLSDLLSQRGFGDANIVRLLNSLEDKKLIRRASLSHGEREDLFSEAKGGNRQAVILQTMGDRRINEFKEKLTGHFIRWQAERSIIVQRAIASARGFGLDFAKWFFNAH